MYEYISGLVADLAPTYAVIDAGGVGYYVNISLQTYSAIEGEKSARLYVHLLCVRMRSCSMALQPSLNVSFSAI